MIGRATRTAAVLAGGYVTLGLAYIVASSAWAAKAAADVDSLALTEITKGVVYVLVTGGLLFAFAAWLFARNRRVELELMRERERLLFSERRALAGTLAAAVAHDFNNLLSTLWVNSEELERPDLEPSDREELRESVRVCLSTARELARGLAEAARGRRVLAHQPTHLPRLVRDTLRLLRGHSMLRACRIDLELGEVEELTTDPVVIAQILTNLALNAGEAVAAAGTLRIAVAATAHGAELTVEDDGPGFGDDDVFTPFVTSHERGSGLGLFSVKAGAELLGGSVAVDRSPLGGARVRIQLPRTSPANLASSPSSAS